METRVVRLSPKKGGHGHITSYSVNIGSAEARSCGFIDKSGNLLPVEKQIDTESGCIILRPMKELKQDV